MFSKAVPTGRVSAAEALPGRQVPLSGLQTTHAVNGAALLPPYPDNHEELVVGMGCFWGAERKFWQLAGVTVTAVGYAGGLTPNPTYEEVCSGRTGHTEAVRVIFDPAIIPLDRVLATFWEGHDPTQGMRQGNDIGTQYRSAIYCSSDAQLEAANASAAMFGKLLNDRGFGEITTEIAPTSEFYFPEAYHQQYLYKNPNGYCGLGGTGVSCPIGIGRAQP